MNRPRYLSHAVRILAIGSVLCAAIAILSQAATGPGWPVPLRSYLSSNDFLTGGSPLNGAVIVTSPMQGHPANGNRSGADPGGYITRARMTNPVWGLGDFEPVFPMTEHRHGAGIVLARGPMSMEYGLAMSPPRDTVSYLYIVGGMDQGAASATIERAEIDADGKIYPGLEAQVGLLKTPRYGAAAVARGDFIYVIGGYDGNDLPLKTIERFQIDALGSLGDPVLMANPGWGGDVAAVIVNGYLYVMGGSDSKRGPTETVQPWFRRAAIDPRGELGPFEEIKTDTTPSVTVHMPVAVAGGRAVVVAAWKSAKPVYSIYYLGGNVGNSDNGASPNVYRLQVADDNSIPGAWAPVFHGPGLVEMLDPRELFAAVTANGYLYVVGGETTTKGQTTYYSHVERAPIGADGTIGQFARLDGNKPTYINQYDRASDISGVAFNNRIFVPGGRDAWGSALDEIFQLNLDQGGESLLSDAVLDASVFGLVSDLGQQTEIQSLAFDVGPDKSTAAYVRVRFRSALSAGDWDAWTPYFNVAALPRDHASGKPVVGEDTYMLDLSYTPGGGSCLDASLVPNPTNRKGPMTARFLEYEVIIPEGSADQKLHRLAVDPRPIVHFALPGGYDPTRTAGSHPPSCAPGHAIADMGVKGGWIRFTGVGFDSPTVVINSDTIHFVSADTQIPVTALAVEIKEAGRILDILVDIDEGQGGPFTYDLVYGPFVGVSDSMTLLSPAIKLHPAIRLEDSRSVPGLDVHPGNSMARENVVQAPTPQKVKEKFAVSLFGDNFRSGRVDDTKPTAVDDPMGPGTWPVNPNASPDTQVPVLRYKVIDLTPAPGAFKPLQLWNATDPTAWREVALGEFGSIKDFKFDLEVNHKAKSGPHDLEITVQNPQMGRTYTVKQTVFVVPAFGVNSFKTNQDPTPDPNPGAENQYDWTGSLDPAVADLGDGVGTAALTIDVTGHGFQSDSGTSLITGVAPVSTVYAPSAGTHAVSDSANLQFTAGVPSNTIPKLHRFSFDWAYQLGVSDPYEAGVQVPPVWDGPTTVTNKWTAEPASWQGLYVVPPRVKIQSVLGSHNTNNPIVVLQSDPTLTVNGAGFATNGPAAGGYASVIHEARLINMMNSPDEDIHPVAGGMHMVSDCQSRLTMNVNETQRAGQMYDLEIETSLPDLESLPGTKVRHPYSHSHGASLVTVLPLPVCQAVAPACLRADQGSRLNGVVVTGKNFDIATKVNLGPGVTIENLDVCHDDAARGCVTEDKLTFDAVVSVFATPGHRLVEIENGPTSAISQKAACATPGYDFWVVPMPSISTVQPSAIQQPPMAAVEKTVTVDVYGANFVPGADIEVTLANGNSTTNITRKGAVVVDSGHITVELTVKYAAIEGVYKLRVVEPSGPTCGTAYMKAEGSFQVTSFKELSLTGVTNQTSQCQGRTGTLAVTGANFKDSAGTVLIASASLGTDVAIDSVVVNSQTSLTINYSVNDGAALGKRSLVLNPIAQGATPATWSDALKVTSSPSISAVSPAAISPGTTREITISGRNFYEGGAAVALDPATGVTVSDVVVVSTGQARATLTVDPGAAPGSRTISLTNADGGQCAVATFNAAVKVVDPPMVTSSKYSQGKVQIKGSNFHSSLQAFVGGSSTAWTPITVKKNTTVTLGKAQTAFLKGEPVTVRLVNPDDGGETTITVTR